MQLASGRLSLTIIRTLYLYSTADCTTSGNCIVLLWVLLENVYPYALWGIVHVCSAYRSLVLRHVHECNMCVCCLCTSNQVYMNIAMSIECCFETHLRLCILKDYLIPHPSLCLSSADLLVGAFQSRTVFVLRCVHKSTVLYLHMLTCTHVMMHIPGT